VVAVVARRREDRHEPHRVNAERGRASRIAVVEIVEVRGETLEVADAVPVGVGEAADEDLVYRAAAKVGARRGVCAARRPARRQAEPDSDSDDEDPQRRFQQSDPSAPERSTQRAHHAPAPAFEGYYLPMGIGREASCGASRLTRRVETGEPPWRSRG